MPSLESTESWNGRYKLVGEPLEDQGNALVQRARRTSDEEIVVIKIGHDEHVRRRFQREIEIGLELDHPNVMPVLDHSIPDLWFVMPLAADEALKVNPDIPNEILFGWLKEICAGLGEAHDKGYVHRDLKPSNILRLAGQLLVADWGVARNAPGTTMTNNPTITGYAQGSWGWSAPELNTTAHNAGASADVYSLGQIIGWILTGDHPNQGIPNIPTGTDWETLVTRCTLLDPAARPQSVEELLAACLDLVPIHVEAELLAQIYELGDAAGGSQFVTKTEAKRIDGTRLTLATWYPSDAHSAYIEDFETYNRFLQSRPESAGSTHWGKAPTAIHSLSISRLVNLRDQLLPSVSDH